jgi:hypothetical protein
MTVLDCRIRKKIDGQCTACEKAEFALLVRSTNYDAPLDQRWIGRKADRQHPVRFQHHYFGNIMSYFTFLLFWITPEIKSIKLGIDPSQNYVSSSPSTSSQSNLLTPIEYIRISDCDSHFVWHVHSFPQVCEVEISWPWRTICFPQSGLSQ